MNKLRIVVFLCAGTILCSACKSVPQPPAKIAVEPDPVLSQMPEKAAENKNQNTGTSDVSLKTGTAVQPELSPPSKPAEQPKMQPELYSEPPKLSLSKHSAQLSDDSGTKSAKPALSLKPKSAVSSGKTAAPSGQPAVPSGKPAVPPEKPSASLRKPAASPMLKPAQVKPEPKKSSAEAEPPAEKIKPEEKIEPQEKKPEKKPEDAPKPSPKTAALPEKELPAVSPAKPALSAVSSSVFDEPEVTVHTDTDDFTEENEADEVQNEASIEPDREEDVVLNQSFDILYEGKNWIFLGEKNQTLPPVVRFLKRSFSGNNTVFSLYAASEGETLLHFYKHDLLENAARDEYVLVRVGAVNSQTDTALSDTTSDPVQDGGEKQLSDTGSQTENTVFAEEMYTQAEKAFDEKKYADALNILDVFFQTFTPEDNGFDKAVFLKARIYESPSEFRNIRTALDEYKKITAFFPESGLYDEARRRITYINRFYMDIR